MRKIQCSFALVAACMVMLGAGTVEAQGKPQGPPPFAPAVGGIGESPFSNPNGSTAPVPQTGQTSCWDEDGIIINPCDGTGQDGDIQAGVDLPDPRFTDNGGTVVDNLTELVWLKDAKCIRSTIPGFDNDDIAGDGKVSWQHALDFVAGINGGANAACDAGFTDWRLPNIRELYSLVDFTEVDPTFPDGMFTFPIGADFNVSYWSSTTVASDESSAWRVNFGTGEVDFNSKLNTEFHVLPVRGP